MSFYTYCKEIGFIVLIPFIFFLLNPFEIGFLGGYLLTVVIYLKKDFIQKAVDNDYFLLLIFSIVYAAFYLFQEDVLVQNFIFYLIFPCLFYLIGKYFASRTSNNNELIYLFLAIAILFATTALISVGLNLATLGFNGRGRDLQLFWNGRYISATGMASYFSLVMCIPAIILISKKKLQLIYKIITLIVFIISLLCAFRLGSRTQVVIFAVTGLIAFSYLLLNQNFNKNIKLVIVLITSTFILNMYFPLDLDSDYLSVLGDRLRVTDSNTTAGGRTDKWLRSLYNLFNKPFGWNISEFGYSHNLWLDVAQSNGIIPFFLLLIFSLRSCLRVMRLILNNNANFILRSIILIFFVSFYLIFFVEPILLGAFSLFILYCFFQGFMNYKLKKL
jgi:hypothetical protein